MKESYGEGLASRTGPESCVAVREGSGEALTGVRAGRVLSREKGLSGTPTHSLYAEGHIGFAAIARRIRVPRGRRPRTCTETPCTEPGRSRVRPGR